MRITSLFCAAAVAVCASNPAYSGDSLYQGVRFEHSYVVEASHALGASQDQIPVQCPLTLRGGFQTMVTFSVKESSVYARQLQGLGIYTGPANGIEGQRCAPELAEALQTQLDIGRAQYNPKPGVVEQIKIESPRERGSIGTLIL